MPNIPAVTTAPLATLGGAVAIPTRASVAAMAAQPAPQAAAPVRRAPAAPAAVAATPPRARTKTSPPKPMTAVPESGSVVEPVEGQPTIPLRALTDKPGGQGAVGPAARLVVLTTDLAGMEIALDKASLVIGRTEENDVLLNHRSISRHHAKIVRDGEHYTIVDLQSANGVRVNGEDYERIELNAGDVVELGHVKLRFVGPLRGLHLRSATRTRPRQFPIKLIAIGGGALAVVALAALLSAPGFARERARDGGGTGRSPPLRRAPLAPPPVAAAPAAPAPPPPPETPAALLAAAKKAMVAEDWETAAGRRSVGSPASRIRRSSARRRRSATTSRTSARRRRRSPSSTRRPTPRTTRRRSLATRRSRRTASTSGGRSPVTRRRARCWWPST